MSSIEPHTDIAGGVARRPPLQAGTVSWLQIDRRALIHNVEQFRSRLDPTSALMAVVKSNAYGHGVEICAPAALEAGASWLAVGGLGEALALRQLVPPKTPILTLNHIPLDDIEAAVAQQISVTVYDPDTIVPLQRAAERSGTAARLHLKLETGTHRQGLECEPLVAFAQRIAATPGLIFEGLSTHFSDIEDTTDHRFAEAQIARYDECVSRLAALGLKPRWRHLACSAATLLFPNTHADLARAGIGIYGLWPSKETLVSARERGLAALELQPVLSWYCSIAQVKQVAAGGYVGYGRSWRASRPSRIAVLPIGYYEGYARALSGRAHVLIAGKRAPLVGRICMNMSMVDVTDIPEARAGAVAVLLGRSGEEQVRAEDLAGWAGTIHYEIVARISATLPRVVIG